MRHDTSRAAGRPSPSRSMRPTSKSPTSAETRDFFSSLLEEARSATRLLGIDLVDHEVSSPEGIRSRLALLGEAKADAYFFISDSLVNSYGTLILEAANALKMPTMVYELDLVPKGALAGYGLNYRQ